MHGQTQLWPCILLILSFGLYVTNELECEPSGMHVQSQHAFMGTGILASPICCCHTLMSLEDASVSMPAHVCHSFAYLIATWDLPSGCVSQGGMMAPRMLAARRLKREPEPFEAEFNEDEFEDGEFVDFEVRSPCSSSNSCMAMLSLLWSMELACDLPAPF